MKPYLILEGVANDVRYLLVRGTRTLFSWKQLEAANRN